MGTSEGLDATSPLKEFILLYLMPEKCFEYFFTNLNFLHGEACSGFIDRV